MTNQTVLANARIVLRDEIVPGSLSIKDGVISGISHGTGVPAGAHDCAGAFLCPGLVELHTDNLERHMRPRPSVLWPQTPAIVAHDRELAGCGITTVFDAIRLGSITTVHEKRFRRYGRAAADALGGLRDTGALKISHHIHLRAEICSETLGEELAEFDASDKVGMISLMDHTPGQRQFRDLAQFEHYVCTKNGMSREGFEDYIIFLQELSARVGARHEAEAIGAARRLGATLASHDDTTAEHVKHSHAGGVTLAEFPTTHEAAEACKSHGIATILGAPNLVRGGSHSGNVAASDLAQSDNLDILSSDYVPGALLLGAFQLGQLWDDLPRALRTVTSTPAQQVGLDDRGEIAIGKRADLLSFAAHDDTPMVTAVWSQGRRVS